MGRHINVAHVQIVQFNKQYVNVMSKEEKPPIHMKMRVGDMEFEIECTEDQIKEVVDKILSTVSEYAKKMQDVPKIMEPTRPARAQTCKGIIQKLWREGWFASARSLGDVHREMMRIGYHYDRTAVAHALLDLVKEGLLTRQGRPRRYVYAQKRPPPTFRPSSP